MATAELTKITVNVTAEDLQAGEKGNCSRCPIALAFQRALPHCRVDVGSRWAWMDNGKDSYDATLPGIATDFVEAFDEGEPAKPFSFSLSVPASFLTPA